MEFLQNKMNLVDVLAIMPYYVELAMREEQKEKVSLFSYSFETSG